ncbi:hypothetical protein ES705_10889 [subsurface metagenome]
MTEIWCDLCQLKTPGSWRKHCDSWLHQKNLRDPAAVGDAIRRHYGNVPYNPPLNHYDLGFVKRLFWQGRQIFPE